MSPRLELKKAAPEGHKAFGPIYQYIASSSLDRALVDLVFLRVSQINGCAYCVDLHWRDMLKAGTDAPDDDYAAVKSQFTEKEIADLTIVIALMNAMNRIGVGTRMQVPVAVAA